MIKCHNLLGLYKKNVKTQRSVTRYVIELETRFEWYSFVYKSEQKLLLNLKLKFSQFLSILYRMKRLRHYYHNRCVWVLKIYYLANAIISSFAKYMIQGR